MATIHVLGIDHDGSAGHAAYQKSSGLYAFLHRLIGDSDDLVYVANDSLRQDFKIDITNLLQNKIIKANKVIFNGSVFYSPKLIRDKLSQSRRQVEVFPLMTADLYPEIWLNDEAPEGEFYYDKVRNAQPGFLAMLSQGYRQDKTSYDELKNAFTQNEYPSHTCYDTSKFLNVWIKIQALSLKHPEDMIRYHFIDDKEEYGKGLCKLFKNYPRLLPSNVRFSFDHCIYYTDGKLETKIKHSGSINGKGKARSDYKALARSLLTKMRLLPGVAFSGVEKIKKSSTLRTLLTGAPEKPIVKKPQLFWCSSLHGSPLARRIVSGSANFKR